MIPDSFKQDLLNRIDIIDVISRSVQLKKAGANHLGLCPFHGEKTPSFTVSPAKQFYHCFGCGAHGNAIGFVMAYGGLGYVDAVKELAASIGMQVPEMRTRTPEEAARAERETDLYALMERAMEFYRAELKNSPRAIAYLKRRGLTGEIAARFRVGYAPEGWQALKNAFASYDDKALLECGLVIDSDEGRRYDRFRDRVMFPILNARGAVIGFGGRVIGDGEPKYLNSPETPLFEKGREIYGLPQARDAIRTAGRVLVVEGYMDVLALAQFGIGYAVATLGTATTPVHVSKLLRLADELVFSFDGDAAGRKAAFRALEVALPLATDHKPIRFLFLPEGEDPDTFVRAHGKEAFEARVRQAETLSQFLLGQLRSDSDLASAEGRARMVTRAKPYVQSLTAPGLRLQLANEIAALGRITEQEVRELMQLPAQRHARPAPARVRYDAPNTPEWSLLTAVLSDLSLVEHLDPTQLSAHTAESAALVAIRDYYARAEEEPTFALMIDSMSGNPCLDIVLKAQRYADDIALDAEGARGEFEHALLRLDLIRRKAELDALLRGGLASQDERVAYQSKLLTYKRLQGALPNP